jgi:hypothetical protein
MSEERPASADRLPTLTEVLELGATLTWPNAAPGPAAARSPVSTLLQPALAPASGLPLRKPVDALVAVPELPMPQADSTARADALLAALLSQVEPLLEARLNQALAPLLEQAAQALLREVRGELAAALKDLVRDAARRLLDEQHPSH